MTDDARAATLALLARRLGRNGDLPQRSRKGAGDRRRRGGVAGAYAVRPRGGGCACGAGAGGTELEGRAERAAGGAVPDCTDGEPELGAVAVRPLLASFAQYPINFAWHK